jgi:hypothetical protein
MCAPVRRSLLLALTLLVPSIAVAQVDLKPTPAPTITAEGAPWYQFKEPVIFGGNTYYPAGAQVFFNGNEMVRSGYYRGVPVYTRTTEGPNSKLYVPLPGKLLQPYERRREGELAGTVGTSTPSFPVERSTDPVSDATAGGSPQASGPPTSLTPPPAASDVPAGNVRPTATSDATPPSPAPRTKPSRKRPAVTIVYIEYDSRKWYSSGPTVEYQPSRFRVIGKYHDLPVYADRTDKTGTIFIPVENSPDALLAPYSRKR